MLVCVVFRQYLLSMILINRLRVSIWDVYLIHQLTKKKNIDTDFDSN